MQFRIDNASDRAVYLQIIDQVKRDIALGRLAKEERLPTVRQGHPLVSARSVIRSSPPASVRSIEAPAGKLVRS